MVGVSDGITIRAIAACVHEACAIRDGLAGPLVRIARSVLDDSRYKCRDESRHRPHNRHDRIEKRIGQGYGVNTAFGRGNEKSQARAVAGSLFLYSRNCGNHTARSERYRNPNEGSIQYRSETPSMEVVSH